MIRLPRSMLQSVKGDRQCPAAWGRTIPATRRIETNVKVCKS